MSCSGYTIRNYRRGDFGAFLEISIAAELADPAGRCVSALTLDWSLARPGYSPERHLFLAEAGGQIVAYLDMTPEMRIGRVVLSFWVHPEHRRKGLASRLVGRAAERAQRSRAGLAHVGVPKGNAAAEGLLSRLGFSPVRTFLDLRLDTGRATQPSDDQWLCRRLEPGEERRLARLQNRAFAGGWGYCPNGERETAWRLGQAGCSHGDVVMACNGGSIIGYCWTRVGYEGVEAGRGRICMIGVDPRWRGRGAGKAALLSAIEVLAARGVKVVDLTVDSGNAPARALYDGLGFLQRATILWHEKRLGGPRQETLQASSPDRRRNRLPQP